MKKMMNWMLAAILICGSTVFTACSTSEDNPGPEPAKKNRTEFVKHTRANLKELAENLNFSSWELANKLNLNFNKYVLTNSEFEKTISTVFALQILENFNSVEEGSELAQMGYKTCATIDFTDFKYRFTVNANRTGFDVEPADNFEMILPEMNPITQQLEDEMIKVTLKAGGSSLMQIIKRFSNEDLVVVAKIPTDLTFSISGNADGSWKDIFTGTFKNEVRMDGTSQFVNIFEDAFNISGIVNSFLPANIEKGLTGDATTLEFAIGQDPDTHEAGLRLNYIHNGKKMVDVCGVLENLNGLTDYKQFSLSSTSLADFFIGIMAGNNMKEGTITLLDDLSALLKIDDCAKVVQLQNAMASARRNYADQQTIEQYTQQLNQLVSGSMTCAHINQYIPMKLQTVKLGIDYWAMPALNFADENGYVPFTDMLDKESIEYMINIADHAIEPMQQSTIVMRQLLQYLRTIMGAVKEQEDNR